MMDRTLRWANTSRAAVTAAFVAMLWLGTDSLRPGGGRVSAAEPDGPTLTVEPTADFAVTGDGRQPVWKRAEWTDLNRRPGGTLEYRSRVKLLYSDTGLYVLMDGTDSRLTATLPADFENLWTEDVFEFFLWTDERYPVYFEYEISPLNKELPILIPNFDGQFLGWRPWHYDGPRRTRKAVSIIAGEPTSGAAIGGWRAEVFVPYELLQPLKNVPPKAGTRWRANFYRVDYDHNRPTAWDWARVGDSFHDYQRFGTLRFK
jgi:hypothetical protein